MAAITQPMWDEMVGTVATLRTDLASSKAQLSVSLTEVGEMALQLSRLNDVTIPLLESSVTATKAQLELATKLISDKQVSLINEKHRDKPKFDAAQPGEFHL